MPSSRSEAHAARPSGHRVQALRGNATLTLLVHGHLDTEGGTALLDAVRSGLGHGVDRLEVDLRDVDQFTDEGADTLVAVRDLGAGLAGGVYYRTTAGAGADALLVAFASADDADAADDGAR